MALWIGCGSQGKWGGYQLSQSSPVLSGSLRVCGLSTGVEGGGASTVALELASLLAYTQPDFKQRLAHSWVGNEARLWYFNPTHFSH
jgi:hypothetical protein